VQLAAPLYSLPSFAISQPKGHTHTPTKRKKKY